ncbi:hypothetical protein ES703_121794 [subsurface metagenome]
MNARSAALNLTLTKAFSKKPDQRFDALYANMYLLPFLWKQNYRLRKSPQSPLKRWFKAPILVKR